MLQVNPEHGSFSGTLHRAMSTARGGLVFITSQADPVPIIRLVVSTSLKCKMHNVECTTGECVFDIEH
jgi:predicted membrane GTPase involved in stress response